MGTRYLDYDLGRTPRQRHEDFEREYAAYMSGKQSLEKTVQNLRKAYRPGRQRTPNDK